MNIRTISGFPEENAGSPNETSSSFVPTEIMGDLPPLTESLGLLFDLEYPLEDRQNVDTNPSRETMDKEVEEEKAGNSSTTVQGASNGFYFPDENDPCQAILTSNNKTARKLANYLRIKYKRQGSIINFSKKNIEKPYIQFSGKEGIATATIEDSDHAQEGLLAKCLIDLGLTEVQRPKKASSPESDPSTIMSGQSLDHAEYSQPRLLPPVILSVEEVHEYLKLPSVEKKVKESKSSPYLLQRSSVSFYFQDEGDQTWAILVLENKDQEPRRQTSYLNTRYKKQMEQSGTKMPHIYFSSKNGIPTATLLEDLDSSQGDILAKQLKDCGFKQISRPEETQDIKNPLATKSLKRKRNDDSETEIVNITYDCMGINSVTLNAGKFNSHELRQSINNFKRDLIKKGHNYLNNISISYPGKGSKLKVYLQPDKILPDTVTFFDCLELLGLPKPQVNTQTLASDSKRRKLQMGKNKSCFFSQSVKPETPEKKNNDDKKDKKLN